MTTPRPTIFIVEDRDSVQAQYAKKLGDQVTIVSATSLKEANEKWERTANIVLVVMDGCVDSAYRPNTQPFIRKIRETFTGPIIAASSSPDYRQQLMKVGCSHEAEKSDVPAKVIEILGLTATV